MSPAGMLTTSAGALYWLVPAHFYPCAYVLNEFGNGVIIPLLKDKHDNGSKLNLYGGITLSPVIAKLFEHILLDLYEDQLSSGQLQFGFKEQSGCCHALFTFKETTKYFMIKGSKYTVHF